MKIFEPADGGWTCGHWNGSPVEIGVTPVLREVPDGEVNHRHPYHEYFVVLEGGGTVTIEGASAEVRAGQIVMIEPGEAHRWQRVGAHGIRWVVIKERSEPGSKTIVEEP